MIIVPMKPCVLPFSGVGAYLNQSHTLVAVEIVCFRSTDRRVSSALKRSASSLQNPLVSFHV